MQKSCAIRVLAFVLAAELLALTVTVSVLLLYALYPYDTEMDIASIAEENGIPLKVVLATIKVESNFKADAVSSKGAIGLMQIMPSTFQWICGENRSYRIDNPIDNVRVGCRYLAYLYNKYQNWDITHAAYNAGDGAVDGWLADPRYSKDGVLTRIPYPETVTYVRRIQHAKTMYQHLYSKI